MFQSNKDSYEIIAVCKKDDKEGRYTFIEGLDENWSDIAESMFYDEFGEYPTEMSIESREKL